MRLAVSHYRFIFEGPTELLLLTNTRPIKSLEARKMRTCRILTIWAPALLLSCKWLVTARPHVHYIRTFETTEITEIFDDGLEICNAADEFCQWALYGLPYIPAVPFNDGMDSIYAVDSGDLPCETDFAAVRAPATVYPHDTTPTPTSTEAVAAPVSNQAKALSPSTLSTSTLLHLQARDAEADAEAEIPDIPSSVQQEESTGVPGQLPTAAPIVDCGGLSSCPPNYNRYLLMGMCWCRAIVTKTLPLSM